MSSFADGAVKSMATWEKKASEMYPTRDIRVTKLLLETHPPPKDKFVWEPACGRGDISRVLQADGYEVFSSDIRKTGFGPQMDFLKSAPLMADYSVITNPPFSLAEAFVNYALADHDVLYLALLLKSNYWHTLRGYELHKTHPCTAVVPVPWRVAFLPERGNSPLMDLSWYVWERGKPPAFKLERPRGQVAHDYQPLLVKLAELEEALVENEEARHAAAP